jgi:glycosyltransferase involved in cell wall biosynthesis
VKKVLFVVPHLSTGGLPQYTLKLIKSTLNHNEVHCVEYDNITGGVLVVQRRQIENVLGNNFYTLDSNKFELLSIIDKINPNIIHFQEIPEHFMESKLLDIIYDNNREYKIVVTTHGSNTDPSAITYSADKFILVSEWSKNRFTEVFPEHMCDVWEYPVESISYDKSEAKKQLNFDENCKHVLNVGLFTSGKNQAELVQIAKLLKNKNIVFHFVGNQSMNFRDYWEPLMKEFPSNCIWHGERSDVDLFYKASDAFYFTSNYELNPLVVKEALSYGLPTFIKKLHTYGDVYDDKVTYIVNDIDVNVKNLLDVLNMSEKNDKIKSNNNIIAMHMVTDIDTDREINSMISLTKLEDYGIEYIPCVNPRYTSLPPIDTCEYPDRVSFEPGGKLTPGHYGCYLAHKNAVLDGISKNPDYLLIFECDAVIDVPYQEFIEKLKFSCDILNKTDLLMFSFGFHNNTNIVEKKTDYWVVNKFYGAHAYLIPRKSYNVFKKLFETEKWNVTDLLYAEKLDNFNTGIFEIPITKQSAGFSILDKVYHEERH